MSSECHCLLEYWLYFILVYICFLNYILKLQKVKQKYLKTSAVCSGLILCCTQIILERETSTFLEHTTMEAMKKLC